MKITRDTVKKTKWGNKKELLFILFPCLHIILFIFMIHNLSTVVIYGLDNYRYVYSALLQVVGGLFAFIASSTLVVLQLLHSNAPNSARFYPKMIFTSFLIITIVVMAFDTGAILYLDSTVTPLQQIVLNLIITINLYPVFLAFLYIFYVNRYLSPKYQTDHIIKEAKKAKTNNKRRTIMYSIEEMFLTAIKAGQGGNVRLYQDALSEIIAIFTNTYIELNSRSKFEPDHPLRLIPDIVERITANLIDNDMSNLLHFNGHILRELTGSRYNDEEIVGVEIACAIKCITDECMAHSRITDLSSFTANFIMCAEKDDGLSTIFWGTRFLIDEIKKHLSEKADAASYIFSQVVSSLYYLFTNIGVVDYDESERMVAFLRDQKHLINICKEMGSNNTEKEIHDIMQLLDKTLE